MDKLLPCPFCGQTDYLEYGQIYDQYMHVVCNASRGGCGATGGGEEFEDGAAREWNTRTDPIRDCRVDAGHGDHVAGSGGVGSCVTDAPEEDATDLYRTVFAAPKWGGG